MIDKLLNANKLEAAWAKFSFRISPGHRANVYEMIAALIQGGTAIDVAIKRLRDRMLKGKRADAPLLASWAKVMEDGESFSHALKGYAPDTEVVIIAAAERSVDIATGLAQAAVTARSNSQIIGTILAQMAEPMIWFSALIVLTIGFSVSFLPQLAGIIPESAMSDTQRTTLHAAKFIAAWWIPGLLLIFASFVAVGISLSRYAGPLRKYLDKVPPWSIYRTYSSSTFMIAMASLVAAGVPMETAIAYIRKHSGPWLRWHLGTMIQQMKSGIAHGDAMETGLLDDETADMVAIYAQTTKFDKAITAAGNRAIDSSIKKVRGQAMIMRLIALAGVSTVVGFGVTFVLGLTDAAQSQSQRSASMHASASAQK